MAGSTHCTTPRVGPPADPELIEVIENAHRSWLEAHAVVDEMEVSSTPELTWMCGPGIVWSNAAVRVRLAPKDADRRLRAATTKAFARGRGFGLWVSDLAQPADVGARLTRMGFRSRKRFPGMVADVTRTPLATLPRGIELREADDPRLFLKHAHPYFGRITTPVRRFELRRVGKLCESGKALHVVAVRRGVPVGAATLHIADRTAIFFDVGVLEEDRGRGIGSGLVAGACAFAAGRGARRAVLLSSGMGYGAYVRAGFREACRIAYWYSAGRQA